MTLNRTTLHELTCPACRARLWGSTAVSDPSATPGEGDATVCDGCGAILIFTQRGVRTPRVGLDDFTPEQARLLLGMSQAVRARRPGEDS